MRQSRKLRGGAVYHVTSEINRNAMDLQEPMMKAAFMEFVKKAKLKYQFQLLNFSVMDNHVHLLIKPGPGQSLSKIMQWIKGNFAKYWNKKHGTKGHLWGERFFSRIVDGESQLKQVFIYIDENPVKAGLVKQAKNWMFSGLYYHLHGREEVVDTAWRVVLGLFPSAPGLPTPTPQCQTLPSGLAPPTP